MNRTDLLRPTTKKTDNKIRLTTNLNPTNSTCKKYKRSIKNYYLSPESKHLTQKTCKKHVEGVVTT